MAVEAIRRFAPPLRRGAELDHPAFAPARSVGWPLRAGTALSRQRELIATVDALYPAREPEATAGRQVQRRPTPRADSLEPRERPILAKAQHRQDHSPDDETGNED